MHSPRSPFLVLLAVLAIVAASCGVTREAAVGDAAATLTFEDGSTATVARSDVDAIVDQLSGNPEATQLVFNQELPPTFNLDVLSSLIQVELLDKALADGGTDLPDNALADELVLLDSQLDQVLSAEPDPAAAKETVQAGTSEYLSLIASQRIRQNAFTTQFETGGGVEVPCSRHILLETVEDADDAIARLDDGEDFAELAMELSTGPSGPGGGDLGCSDPGGFVPEFRDAVIAAPEGEPVGPVETSFGFHVILVYGTDVAAADPQIAQAQALDAFTALQNTTQVSIDDTIGTWDAAQGAVVPLSP